MSSIIRAAGEACDCAGRWFAETVSPRIDQLGSEIESLDKRFVDVTNKLCGDHILVAIAVRFVLRLIALVALQVAVSLPLAAFSMFLGSRTVAASVVVVVGMVFLVLGCGGLTSITLMELRKASIDEDVKAGKTVIVVGRSVFTFDHATEDLINRVTSALGVHCTVYRPQPNA